MHQLIVLQFVFLADFDTGNPLDVLVMNGPNEVNMLFGMEFIDKVRRIKNDCEWKEYLAETDLQREMQELLQFKENMEEFSNEEYFKDLPPDEQNQVQKSFQLAYEDLLQKESNREDKLARECNNALMKLEDERMENVLKFAMTKMERGIGAFAAFVNQVEDYGMVIQNALAQCLDTYADEILSRYSTLRMSPSEVCMQVEVEVLVRFIQEFVVRASQLVISYSDDEDFASPISGSGSIESPPPRLPESFPRTHQLPQEPDTVEENKNAESDTTDRTETAKSDTMEETEADESDTMEETEADESNIMEEIEDEEPDTMEETEFAEFDTDDNVDRQNDELFGTDFNDLDQNHKPIPSPVSHDYTEQSSQELSSAIASHHAQGKSRPIDLPSHESGILIPQPSPAVGGGTDRSGSKG